MPSGIVNYTTNWTPVFDAQPVVSGSGLSTVDRPCTSIHVSNLDPGTYLYVWIKGIHSPAAAGTPFVPSTTDFAVIPPNQDEIFRLEHNSIQYVVFKGSGAPSANPASILNVVAHSKPLKA